MALHVRLIDIEMYLPDVQSDSDTSRAFGALKRYCKSTSNVAFAIEPFTEPDRGTIAITVIGMHRPTVEQDTDKLLQFIEAEIQGQSLSTSTHWL